jgi:hypothetical protein
MLMEACLDLAHNHADWITGIQDLGAAGLSASSAESAARGGTGLVIDVSKVARREEEMTPYEVMLSESQERMLIIVRKGHEDDVAGLFDRWEVPSTIIGHVTDDGIIRIWTTTRGQRATVCARRRSRVHPRSEPSEELFNLQNMDVSNLDVTDANATLCGCSARTSPPNTGSTPLRPSVLNTNRQAGGDGGAPHQARASRPARRASP